MIELGLGSKCIQKGGDGILGAAATLVEGKLRRILGAAIVQALRQLVVGFLPADAAPFARSPRADTLEGVEQAFGVVLVVETGLAPGA